MNIHEILNVQVCISSLERHFKDSSNHEPTQYKGLLLLRGILQIGLRLSCQRRQDGVDGSYTALRISFTVYMWELRQVCAFQRDLLVSQLQAVPVSALQ